MSKISIGEGEYEDLTPDELDKLILRTFKIDRSVIREIDGLHERLNMNLGSCAKPSLTNL